MSDAPSAPADDGTRETESGIEGAVDSRDVPDWDDEYLDRVSDRLMHNYDLEKDRSVAGERFALYGYLELHSQKHVFHPALSFGEHGSYEHLFVTRLESVDDAALDRFVDLGHRLADEWLEPDEEHFCTEFTFVAVAPSLPDGVRTRVEAFRDRTLLSYGYHGHYEINLLVASPDDEALAASENADVAAAFRLWEPIEREEPGLLGLLARRLQL